MRRSQQKSKQAKQRPETCQSAPHKAPRQRRSAQPGLRRRGAQARGRAPAASPQQRTSRGSRPPPACPLQTASASRRAPGRSRRAACKEEEEKLAVSSADDESESGAHGAHPSSARAMAAGALAQKSEPEELAARLRIVSHQPECQPAPQNRTTSVLLLLLRRPPRAAVF